MSDMSRIQIRDAVDTIKTAILQSQQMALQSVNYVQLSLYYSIGTYVSIHSRDGHWGENTLEAISNELKREMPGLRGFSARNLKNMRIFAEQWALILDMDVVNRLSSRELANSADASAEFRTDIQKPHAINSIELLQQLPLVK